MLNIYNRQRLKVAVLENAFNISEERRANAIYTLSFSLPDVDPKNEYCQTFWYVERDGRRYRIMQTRIDESETGAITYECEHVIAVLLDTVMNGYHVIGNVGTYTRDCINYVLARQSDWVLAGCDFARQFEYGWEQENLLSALFSIAEPITDLHMWDYDTTVYPYRLYLRRVDISAPPTVYVRKSLNQLQLSRQTDPKNICTRLYCYGAGEGINQIRLAEGYLQSPQSYVDRYGIIERIWTDRRYLTAETLRAAGVAMLAELQEPIKEYSVNFIGDCRLGDVVKLEDGYINIITSITEAGGDTPEKTITIANKPSDIANSVAELADRQRVESTYSQGATQMYSQSLQGNADTDNGLELNFYIADDMIFVNKVKAKISVKKFRAYSKATAGGGATTTSSGGSSETTTKNGGGTTTSSGASSATTTSAGGGTTTSSGASSATTTSNGGGTTTSSGASSATTTSNGGGTTTSSGASTATTTSAGGNATIAPENWEENLSGLALCADESLSNYTLNSPIDFNWSEKNDSDPIQHQHEIYHTHLVPAHTHDMAHTHSLNIPAHTHQMAHTHNLNIPAHTHDMKHTHEISIPNHNHDINAGIYFFGNPTGFVLKINGAQKAAFNSTGAEIDITEMLTGDDGMIDRGAWQCVEIVPNDLAYITIDICIQGFIQSRGSGNY